MKKLLNTALLFFVCATLIGVNCFGQLPDVWPKTDNEWEAYIEKSLKPEIDDSLITKNFEKADLVFEGLIIKSTYLPDLKKLVYEIMPYKFFKGNNNEQVIKIITEQIPKQKNYDLEYYEPLSFPRKWSPEVKKEWSHETGEYGIYFVRKTKNDFDEFVADECASISYGDLISPVKHEVLLNKLLYKKITKLSRKSYKNTAEYKKKEDFTKKAKENQITEITSFSCDTIPAGILDTSATGLSILYIEGDNFGDEKGKVFLPNANNGGARHFRLHNDKHILSWNNNTIKILVPSKGYISNTQDGLKACAGSGFVKIVINGDTTLSAKPLTIPYAINNVAENANPDLPELYTPYEVHLRNANGAGGYTFVYDTSFYNNRLAMAAFRRALETWRCATGINFKQKCDSYNLCQNDESSTRILVSFAQPCFGVSTGTALATSKQCAKS